MLGFYENFPKNVHKTARFATPISTKRLQQTLVQVFQGINSKTFNLEDVADPSVHQCTVMFEFGIAEVNNFNYIDSEETTKALEVINKKPLQIMDFFCAIRYYKTQNERKIPLRFDYYMIRFVFNKNSIETQVFHERGPRYISPEDIVNLVVDKINETFSKKMLKALETS
jgi:hypothetical protein